MSETVSRAFSYKRYKTFDMPNSGFNLQLGKNQIKFFKVALQVSTLSISRSNLGHRYKNREYCGSIFRVFTRLGLRWSVRQLVRR
jgi:hypothetical protein